LSVTGTITSEVLDAPRVSSERGRLTTTSLNHSRHKARLLPG
jgi:hypothetical protein